MSLLITGGLGGPAPSLITGGYGMSTADTTPPPPRMRDDLVVKAIVDALIDTAEFGKVWRGTGPGDLHVSADYGSWACAWADSWTEASVSDSGDHEDYLHVGRAMVGVAVRDDDPEARASRLHRLINHVANLSGTSLGGMTFPGMTVVGAGRRNPQFDAPDAGWVLVVEWAAEIPGGQAHDIIDDEE